MKISPRVLRLAIVLSGAWLLVSISIYATNLGFQPGLSPAIALWYGFPLSPPVNLYESQCSSTGMSGPATLSQLVQCENVVFVPGVLSFIVLPAVVIWLVILAIHWVAKAPK